MTSVFARNLSFDTTEEGLTAHCINLGLTPTAVSIASRDDGRSRGWALLHFATPEQAAAAIGALDNTTLDGRPLGVREARPEKDDTPAPAPAHTERPRREPRTPRNDNSNSNSNTSAFNHQSDPAQMSTSTDPTNKLYVGNLAWEVTSENLKALFSEFNPSNAEVYKRLSGRSKGFGTVEFATSADAQAALNRFNGTEVQGRQLAVRFDRQQTTVEATDRLFVGNLPWSVDDEALASMFSGLNIVNASVKMVNERSRGYGIVQFASQEDATHALQVRGEFEYGGRNVFARYDKQPL